MSVTDYHIETARAHLEQLKAQADSFGGPCWKCRFGRKGSWSWERTCSNPLVRRGEFDQVTGKTAWKDGDQREMRRSGGMCGPTGQLFEMAAPHKIIWRATPWWAWLIAGLTTYFVMLIWSLA